MLAKIWNSRFWIVETRADVLESAYEKALQDAGFHIVGKVSKCFYPQGFTCLFLLSESHLALHTFPEHGKTYVELSSCNEKYFQAFQDMDIFEHA